MRPLVELIDRYQSGFARKVRPAAPEFVDELVALAGPLPGAYRRFLETMGGDMAGFSPSDADFNVEDRLLNYQLNESLTGSPFLLIASGGPLEPGGSLFLDRNERTSHDDCLLVVIPYEIPMDFTNRTPFHAGLEEFLYVGAYRTYRMPLFPAARELVLRSDVEPSASHVHQAFALAERLGFSRTSPLVRSALFERGDAAIVMYRQPHVELFSLQVGADEVDELLRLADVFTRNLPMQVRS
jgi:hypothetical protein